MAGLKPLLAAIAACVLLAACDPVKAPTTPKPPAPKTLPHTH